MPNKPITVTDEIKDITTMGKLPSNPSFAKDMYEVAFKVTEQKRRESEFECEMELRKILDVIEQNSQRGMCLYNYDIRDCKNNLNYLVTRLEKDFGFTVEIVESEDTCVISWVFGSEAIAANNKNKEDV